MDMEVDMSDDDWNEEIAVAIFESISAKEIPVDKIGAEVDKSASEDDEIATEKESPKKQVIAASPKTPIKRLRFSRSGSFDLSGEREEDKEFGFVPIVPKDLPDPIIYKTKWSFCFQQPSDTLENSKSKSGVEIDSEKITIDDDDDDGVIDLTGDDFGMDQSIFEASKERKDAAVSYNEKDGKKLMKISFSKAANQSVKRSSDSNKLEKKKDPDEAEGEEKTCDESNNDKVNVSEKEIVSDSLMKDDENEVDLKAGTEAVSSLNTSCHKEPSDLDSEESSAKHENQGTEQTIAEDIENVDFREVSDPTLKCENEMLNENKSDIDDVSSKLEKSTRNTSEANTDIDGMERNEVVLTDDIVTESQKIVSDLEVMLKDMGQQSNKETPVAIDHEKEAEVSTIEACSIEKKLDICDSSGEKSPDKECIKVGSEESSQEWLSCSKAKEIEQLGQSKEKSNVNENKEKLKNEKDSQQIIKSVSMEESDTCTDKAENRDITVDLYDADVVASVECNSDKDDKSGPKEELTTMDLSITLESNSGNDNKSGPKEKSSKINLPFTVDEPTTIDMPITVDLTDEDIIALAESDSDEKITPVFSSKEIEERAEVKRQAMGFVCETDSDSDSDSSSCPPSPTESVLYDDYVELSSDSGAENNPSSVNQGGKHSNKHTTVTSEKDSAAKETGGGISTTQRSRDGERTETHSSSGWLTSRVTSKRKTVDSGTSEDEDIVRNKHIARKKTNRGQPLNRFKPGKGEDTQHGNDKLKVRKNVPGTSGGGEGDKDENSEKSFGFGFKNRNRRIHYRKQSLLENEPSADSGNTSFLTSAPTLVSYPHPATYTYSKPYTIQTVTPPAVSYPVSYPYQAADTFSKPYTIQTATPPAVSYPVSYPHQAADTFSKPYTIQNVTPPAVSYPVSYPHQVTNKVSNPYSSSLSSPLFPSAGNYSSQTSTFPSVSCPSQVTDKYSKSHTSSFSSSYHSRNNNRSQVAPVAPSAHYGVSQPSFVPVSRSLYALSASSGFSSTTSGSWHTSQPSTSSTSTLSDLQTKVLEMTGLEINAGGTVQPKTAIKEPEPVVPAPVVPAPAESLATLVNKLTEVKELLETVSQSEQLGTVPQTAPDMVVKDYAHSSRNAEYDDRNRGWSMEDDARTRYERQREHRRYEDDYAYRQEEQDRLRYEDSYRRPYEDDYDQYDERYAREPQRSQYEDEDPYYADRYERSHHRHDYPHPRARSRPGYHVEEFVESQEAYEHDYRASERNVRPPGHRPRAPVLAPRSNPSPVRPPSGKPRPLLNFRPTRPPRPSLGAQGHARPPRPSLGAQGYARPRHPSGGPLITPFRPRGTRPIGPRATMHSDPRPPRPRLPLSAPPAEAKKATIVSARTGKVLAHNKVDLNPNTGRNMVGTHTDNKGTRSNMPAFLTGITAHDFGQFGSNK